MRRKKVGIIGCGAMGSAIARLITERCADRLTISCLCDKERSRAEQLSHALPNAPKVISIVDVVKGSDIVVEAASVNVAPRVARQSLDQGKDVLIMSVGGLLLNGTWKQMEERGSGRLFVASGAVGGLDALTAIRRESIDEVLLRTCKPPQALSGNAYLEERGIDVHQITSRQKIFSGSVEEAIKGFPQNINVAASISLALRNRTALRVEIYCDPTLTRNTHEILAFGSFGKVTFKTENVPSPENPKTSQLAVLSAVATLEKMLDTVHVGT